MLLDRPGERTYPHDAVVDLDDLRNRPYGALSDDETCALTHEFGSECFVEERPRQTRLVLAGEVDDQVELGELSIGIHAVTHRSTDSEHVDGRTSGAR